MDLVSTTHELRSPTSIETYQSVCGSTNAERDELNSPEPAHTLPSNGEEGHVEVKESGHSMVRGLCREVRHATEDDHATAHATSTKDRQSASTKILVNTHDRDDGRDKEPSSACSRQDQGNPIRVPKLLTKHRSQELNEKVYSSELLHELQQSWDTVSRCRELTYGTMHHLPASTTR